MSKLIKIDEHSKDVGLLNSKNSDQRYETYEILVLGKLRSYQRLKLLRLNHQCNHLNCIQMEQRILQLVAATEILTLLEIRDEIVCFLKPAILVKRYAVFHLEKFRLPVILPLRQP